MIISSRCHRIASVLNPGIPCLTIDWNHKYGMLFKDFDLEEGVIDIKQ